eukprot:395623_1
MGSYFTTGNSTKHDELHDTADRPITSIIVPQICVQLQIYYVITYWIRRNNLHSFPRDIIDIIVSTFTFQNIFDTEHDFKLLCNGRIRSHSIDPVSRQTNKHPNQMYDYLFKFLIIGDSGVGKTALIERFTDDIFGHAFGHAWDFKIITKEIYNKRFKLQIWDTCGQEGFQNIYKSDYRGAHGILMVYDITDEDSLNNIKYWNNSINKYQTKYIHRIVVGNKSDLIQDRCVLFEKAQQLCNEININECMEVSAKTNDKVDDVFMLLTKQIYAYSQLSLKRYTTPFHD